MTITILSQGERAYIDSLKANSTEPGFWDSCAFRFNHVGNVRATHVITDDYYPTFEDAQKAGVEWGMKACHSCYISYVRDGFSRVLIRRPKVSLTKRNECSHEAGSRIKGQPPVCHYRGTHYIIAMGSRIWFCAEHIQNPLRAGFETFMISKDGKVKCTTEFLEHVFKLWED